MKLAAALVVGAVLAGVIGIGYGAMEAALALLGLVLVMLSVHAALFWSASIHRGAPAEIVGWRRQVFLAALLALLASVIAGGVVATYVLEHVSSATRTIGSFLLFALVAILALRVWRLPSALRAALLHCAATFLGVPVILGLYGVDDLFRGPGGGGLRAMMFASVLVICLVCIVLERVFTTARDREPSSLPAATVHRDTTP